jgi:hypothetical protein
MGAGRPSRPVRYGGPLPARQSVPKVVRSTSHGWTGTGSCRCEAAALHHRSPHQAPPALPAARPPTRLLHLASRLSHRVDVRGRRTRTPRRARTGTVYLCCNKLVEDEGAGAASTEMWRHRQFVESWWLRAEPRALQANATPNLTHARNGVPGARGLLSG